MVGLILVILILSMALILAWYAYLHPGRNQNRQSGALRPGGP